MANVNYQDLFWQVRTELPGVPVPVLFFNYAEAVRTHLARSLAWQHNCPSLLDLNAATAFPTLVAPTDIPTNTYVVEPVKIKWLDGTTLPFMTRDQLDETDSNWEATTASTADNWTITGPGAFRIYPLLSESVTDAIRLRVALAPIVGVALSATAIPEELAREFSAAWSRGALSRLMKIPGKDWTDVKLAGSYDALFEEDIKAAKSRAAADYGRPRRTVQYGGLSIGGSGRRNTDDFGQ